MKDDVVMEMAIVARIGRAPRNIDNLIDTPMTQLAETTILRVRSYLRHRSLQRAIDFPATVKGLSEQLGRTFLGAIQGREDPDCPDFAKKAITPDAFLGHMDNVPQLFKDALRKMLAAEETNTVKEEAL